MQTKETWYGKLLHSTLPTGVTGVCARFNPDKQNLLRARFTLPQGTPFEAPLVQRLQAVFGAGASEHLTQGTDRDGRTTVVLRLMGCALPLTGDM